MFFLLKTLEIIERDNLLDNCKKQGEYFLENLKMLQKKHKCIGDVRGIGLMDAIEIVDENGEPDATKTARIKELALEKDLLLLTCGSDHNVVRFIAPITVTSAEIDKCIKILDEVLEEIC